MAIDRMKKLTIVCQVAATQRLIKMLHDLSVVQLTDASAECKEAGERLQRPEASAEKCDGFLHKINLILGLMDVFAPVQEGFFASLAPVPLIIDPKELCDTAQHFDLDGVFNVALELDTAHRNAERAVADLNNQLQELGPLEDIPFALSDLRKPKRVGVVFGVMTPKALVALRRDPEAARVLAWEHVAPGKSLRKNGTGKTGAALPEKGRVRVLAAFLKENEEAARKLLAANGFEETSLPALPGKVRDHIRELKGDRAYREEEIKMIAAKVKDLTVHRRALQVLRAFWENRKMQTLAHVNGAHGKWVQVLTGYIREKDLPDLHHALDKEFPGASLAIDDPAPGDDVPVSISLPPFVRPVQLLINMFGLPAYDFFDPSPYLMFSFFLFFGICFGDVAYGAVLIALSWYIMRRTRPYENLYNFAKLLLYAGIPTVIFGFLLGSFCGDLYSAEYLGEGNPLLRLMTAVTVLSPMDKPVVALLAALAIGMLNQFYALALRMYGALKRGDKATAVYDGLFWLVALPGFVILVGAMFAPLPPALFRTGLALFALGGLGLVLTQGRNAKNPIARLVMGVISLYGIVGGYGVTSFIGDTMSYCRLLALGLTTSIVAMSFNMIAGLLRPIPYAGPVLFVLALLLGHLFNFSISVLGAFVHSMRLILVEFFGRFYEGGARPFTPLGFDSGTAILKRTGS